MHGVWLFAISDSLFSLEGERFNVSKVQEIHIFLSVEDVYKIRPDLTEDQAIEVLLNVKNNHNADIGICWDTLIFWADSMFPKSESWGNFTVIITETLQLRVDVEANSFDEAQEVVKRAYRDGVYVLGAQHFAHVDFAEADSNDLLGEAGDELG